MSRSFWRPSEGVVRPKVAVAAILLTVVLLAPTMARGQALQCNSLVNLSEVGGDPNPMPGSTARLELSITNDSFDEEGGDDDQTYTLIRVFPACTSTEPCTPDLNASPPPDQPLSWVGNPATDCDGGVPNLTVDRTTVPTQWDFNFSAPVVLANTASCTIEFDVRIENLSENNPNGEINVESSVEGSCDSGLTSTSGSTLILQPQQVPTLGTVAFLILVLLLATGSAILLRRW